MAITGKPIAMGISGGTVYFPVSYTARHSMRDDGSVVLLESGQATFDKPTPGNSDHSRRQKRHGGAGWHLRRGDRQRGRHDLFRRHRKWRGACDADKRSVRYEIRIG